MIRPPSNLRKYDAFFSGDPAVVQLPKDATEEQHAERDRKIRVARETGRWEDILVAGESPTLFTMQPLSTEVFGQLFSRLQAGEQSFRVFVLAFRCALVDAKNLPDGVKVEFTTHPEFGTIATTSFLDKAGCGGELGATIVYELGALAFERARSASPN